MDKPIFDVLLEGNEDYVRNGWDPSDRELGAPPALRLAVVACMYTRHNVEKVLGLKHGDAKVIRNAGNVVGVVPLRSPVVAGYMLGVRRIAIFVRPQCGMSLVGRAELGVASSIAGTTELPLAVVTTPEYHKWLGGFQDP